jgi:aerobic-type carbon monoxide dehydrogenase small subunit (CoxS/CutS family)
MPKKPSRPKNRRVGPEFTRRGFLGGLGAAAGAAAIGTPVFARAQETRVLGPGPVKVALTVNGERREVEVEPRVTLLNALRNHLDLTGTKKICDRGSCGGCTVLVDGAAVNSCLMLTVDAEGRKVETIEGLSAGGKLHPLQAAFCEHDALQCGFCTPGMVLAAVSLINENKKLDEAAVRHGLEGNLCRCTGYHNIVQAVLSAAKATKAQAAK